MFFTWNFVTIFDGLYSFDHPLDPEEGMKEREGGTEGTKEERILTDTWILIERQLTREFQRAVTNYLSGLAEAANAKSAFSFTQNYPSTFLTFWLSITLGFGGLLFKNSSKAKGTGYLICVSTLPSSGKDYTVHSTSTGERGWLDFENQVSTNISMNQP